MAFYYGAMLITVLSNVGYHVCQRAISTRVNPLVSLAATYTVALLATLIAIPLFPSQGTMQEQLREANWASYALGFAAVGLEVGFLLAYRAGWKVSIAALVSNAAVTLFLIPVGITLFQEKLDLRRGAGIALAGAGLWLLSGH